MTEDKSTIPDEIFEKLSGATWPRPVSLTNLLDELIEHDSGALKVIQGGDQTTGVIVATVLSLRRKVGLKIYELGKVGDDSD